METKVLSKKYVEENYVHKDRIREILNKLENRKTIEYAKMLIEELLEQNKYESEDK